MGKPIVKTPNKKYFITDGVVTHYFPTDFDRRAAQYFIDKKAYLLYALAVDYPGLYKIPLYYRDAVRKAFKEIGFKTSRSKYESPRDWDFSWKDRAKVSPPFVILYFLGPKKNRHSFGCTSARATSFKVWFGKVGGLF